MIGVIILLILWTVMGFGVPIKLQYVKAQELPSEPERIDEFFGGHTTIIVPARSALEIIADQGERLAHLEILLSKYAQKNDSLRFSCR